MTIILGGGISGLTACYYLAKNCINNLELYEAAGRLGGLIKTKRNFDMSYLFEFGPQFLMVNTKKSSVTIDLIEDLRLTDSVLNATHYRQPSTHSFPVTMNPIQWLCQFLNGIGYNYLCQRIIDQNTIYLMNQIGCMDPYDKTDIMDQIRIYQTKIKTLNELSFKFLANRSDVTYDRPGDFKQQCYLGNWETCTFRSGIECLPLTIAEYLLQKCQIPIHTNCCCKAITFLGDNIFLSFDGIERYTNCIVSALPSYVLADLVQHQHPCLAEMLIQIPYKSIGIVNMQLITNRFDQWHKIPKTMNFVWCPTNNIAIFYNESQRFNISSTLTIYIMGNQLDQINELKYDMALKKIETIAFNVLEKYLGIQRKFDFIKCHDTVLLKNVLPIYTRTHTVTVSNIRKYIYEKKLNLILCGSSYDGVGINEIIWSIKQQIGQMFPCEHNLDEEFVYV